MIDHMQMLHGYVRSYASVGDRWCRFQVLCVRMPEQGWQDSGWWWPSEEQRLKRGAGGVAETSSAGPALPLQSHISQMKGVPRDRYDQSVKVGNV